MPARTHTRPHPAPTGGSDARLPWWALALPVLAFITLLVLIRNPSDAGAASGDPAISHLLERAQQLLAR
ncbi:hypothetical protein LK07_07045 [Streptomyces pluripotens]|uniref:Uncharacterized protein n=1 Tax=Streptomyces pluripotens TaxID=1355015 RepID=A0A221NV26_9ACTN|nr:MULTISPECIES: hypothetical protein [Streptomyces]ARP69559.1 hypothetical protein LK06_005945 [Streptomyces pluripotens]ASN23817.1 hypothetical protein LK07_07045 [Streptomyces pluripotens]KIE24486.1 hypothetical protein LK08_23850 [Streptomyces sp. MUSC 125]MCH0558690.1 hypothetical protein [Streptomyces sp. MUM 16J]